MPSVEKKYWLMKSEPDVFSIDDLKSTGPSLWDGVRNYQARNFMIKEMQLGDLILFYHSNASPPGVAGIAKVASPAVPDPTATDKKSKYFDPKATPNNPRWYCVKVSYQQKFKNYVSLPQIKAQAQLKKMLLVKPGMRLSIQPVTEKEFNVICQMGGL